MMITGILLAAGESRRFGDAKLLHIIDGRPLVYHTLSGVLGSSLDEVIVVAPPAPSALAGVVTESFSADTRLRVLVNETPARGMMSSLKVGLRALGAHSDGAMVIHGDMPFVTAEVIDSLLAAFVSRPGIVIAACDGEPRHPRIIPRALYTEFLALADHEKGLAIIDRHPDDIVLVPVGSPTDYADIDRPADLDAFRRARRDNSPEVESSDS